MTHLPGRLVGLAIMAALLLFMVRGIDAHKGITSRYTYNDDVFPILRDKCGSCHVEGGAAPMSLMTYAVPSGAVAWAESIRENLVAEAMPPWYIDPAGPAARGGHTLTPRELDIVLTWATGGTPQGDLRKTPPPMRLHNQWTLGPPDLVLPAPTATTLAAGQMEATADYSIPSSVTETKWLRAVDVLPGTPSLVRSATVSIEGGPVLALWQPGGDAVAAPQGTAFKLAAGARLLVHIRYKKSYLDEQTTKSDRSTVGLYFAAAPPSGGKEITSFDVPGGAAVEAPAGTASRFSASLDRGGRLLALRPSVDQPYASVAIDAVTSSGRRTPLLKLRGIRPEWPRRYWLANPIELPAQSKIEVSAIAGDPDSGPLTTRVASRLAVALDYVPQ